MEPYEQNIRRLIVQERIEQLARDYRSVPRDRRGLRGRLDVRELVGVGAYRRARKAQLSRS
jgi:hypothetical protein